MSVHLERALEGLKKKLLTLAALVEEQVLRSVTAQSKGDKRIAEEVIHRDKNVDDMEVEIEEACIQLIALYQPVAADLRLVVSILKINNDLERIGDYAVNIAERATFLADHAVPVDAIHFQDLAQRVRDLLRQSLDSLINLDVNLARQICHDDLQIDEIHQQNYVRVEEMIRKHPDFAGIFMQYVSISRCLERIADQATNIAEDVLYLVEGRILRHQSELKQ